MGSVLQLVKRGVSKLIYFDIHSYYWAVCVLYTHNTEQFMFTFYWLDNSQDIEKIWNSSMKFHRQSLKFLDSKNSKDTPPPLYGIYSPKYYKHQSFSIGTSFHKIARESHKRMALCPEYCKHILSFLDTSFHKEWCEKATGIPKKVHAWLVAKGSVHQVDIWFIM